MCDNKINWIPQLFRNKELKYFKRSWSKIRIGEKKIISNCNFLLDCTTIFYKLSSSGDSAGIWPGWILLEKHLHLSLKDLTSAVLTIPLLCLPRKLTRVYLPLSSWMGKPCYVAPLQQLLLKSPFTEIQLLSIWIRQVGWILGTILRSPKGEYGRKTECGRWRTDRTNKQNKTAATCLPTCSSSDSYFMQQVGIFHEVVLHLLLLLLLVRLIFPWDISVFHCFSHFQALFSQGNLKGWGFQDCSLPPEKKKKKVYWLSCPFLVLSFSG